MWVKKAATAAGLVVAVMGALPGVAAADPTTPAPAPAPAPTPANGPAPKTSVDADGTYAVGTDIVPLSLIHI